MVSDKPMATTPGQFGLGWKHAYGKNWGWQPQQSASGEGTSDSRL